MKRIIKGIMFYALTWVVITILIVIFQYLFFRPEGYDASIIIFFIENFERDLVVIFFVWGILTIFFILAYFKIKSSD